MLNIRTRVRTDLNLSKRIRSRIRSEISVPFSSLLKTKTCSYNFRGDKTNLKLKHVTIISKGTRQTKASYARFMAEATKTI